MEHTLLPRNVERRQWVNRYYRIKVLSNVAELSNSSHVRAKTQRSGKVCQANALALYTRGFFFRQKQKTGGGKMDAGPHLCMKIKTCQKLNRGALFIPLMKVDDITP